jgi:hypothetical protein
MGGLTSAVAAPLSVFDITNASPTVPTVFERIASLYWAKLTGVDVLI